MVCFRGMVFNFPLFPIPSFSLFQLLQLERKMDLRVEVCSGINLEKDQSFYDFSSTENNLDLSVISIFIHS